MENQLSRRTALLALGGATAVAAVPVAALSQPSAIDLPFEKLVSNYRAAQAQRDDYDDNIYLPAYQAYDEAHVDCLKACAAIPHRRVATPYQTIGGDMKFMSTSSASDLAQARAKLRDAAEWQMGPFEPFSKACRQLVEAESQREVEKARIAASFNVDQLQQQAAALADKSDELGDAAHAALRVVLAHPSANLQTLLVKLDLIKQEELEPEGVWDEIEADIRRLAVGEA